MPTKRTLKTKQTSYQRTAKPKKGGKLAQPAGKAKPVKPKTKLQPGVGGGSSGGSHVGPLGLSRGRLPE